MSFVTLFVSWSIELDVDWNYRAALDLPNPSNAMVGETQKELKINSEEEEAARKHEMTTCCLV